MKWMEAKTVYGSRADDRVRKTFFASVYCRTEANLILKLIQNDFAEHQTTNFNY